MSMIVIRLCWFQSYDSELLRQPGDIQREWCSPRDFVQLLVKSLRTGLRFGIFFGLSNNTGRCWDIGNARELLGYEPEDDSEVKFAKDIQGFLVGDGATGGVGRVMR